MKVLSFLLTLLCVSFFTSTAFAQENNTGKISGQIINNNQAPAAFATVTLLKASDSTLVKGAISDTSGKYHFEKIPFGNYIIEVSLTGINKVYTQPFSLIQTQDEITIPAITLGSNTEVLKSVQVKAIKPFIQHKPGQTIVNVENSPVSAGNSVMEVLQKSPGIFVDQDGNISMNGKSGVNVMFNGQPTHVSASQLATMLKAMPASSVSQIELMTQPPSKYSAEGTAGLINIVLKKNTNMGFNGNLTAGAGYGQYPKYNAGGSINYKNKHFSLYSNYNFAHTNNKFEMDIDRYFYEPDSKIIQTQMKQASIMKSINNNNTAQLGMDFYLTPKQTIGFVANGSFNQGDFNTYSPVYFMNGTGNTDSISTSTNHIGYNWQNKGANVHYTLDNGKGSSLTTNLDYNRFYMSMPQSLITNVTDAQGNQLHDPKQQKGTQPSNINIYAAKLDYVHPFKNQIKLSAGLKYSFVNSDNNSQFEIFKNDNWVNDAGNTNHFIYKENVNAAYASLSKTFNKGWSADAGLRGEQTIVHTDQLNSDSLNKNNYFDLFPNLSLTKIINPNHILSLSFARRIDRPDYQSLNPFIYYVDEYTYREGNPYLKPQFINSTELSYTLKQKYSAVLSYSNTSDIMTQVIRQVDSTHVTYQTMDNLSTLNNLTLTLGIPVNITPWWHTYNSLQGYYNLYKGVYDGFALNKGITSFMLYTQQNFILPHGWKGDLSGMYRSSSIMGPTIISPMGMVSAGIAKSLLKDKATIKLNVQDIFQTMNFNGKINFGDINANSEFHLLDRAANLTFTWNFGNQKVKVNQYKNTGIQQEENRLKNANSGTGTPK
ncbi:MAG TPA: TonB-dependent receptor [Hanamia sp.]|nr:TonB-dependent receptor [Hanamia sp.]